METNFEPGGPHDALERDLYEGEGTRALLLQQTEPSTSHTSGAKLHGCHLDMLTDLAAGTGQETESDRSSQDGRRRSVGTPPSSPPGSPRPDFAPRGPVTPMFKSKIPRGLALNVGLAQGVSKIAESVRLKELQGAYKVSHRSPLKASERRLFLMLNVFLRMPSTRSRTPSRREASSKSSAFSSSPHLYSRTILPSDRRTQRPCRQRRLLPWISRIQVLSTLGLRMVSPRLEDWALQ